MKRHLLALALFGGAVALVQDSSTTLAQPPFKKFPEKKGFFPGSKGAPEATGAAFNDKPTAEQTAFFEKKIRPVLVDQCGKCHSSTSEKIKGGVDADAPEGEAFGRCDRGLRSLDQNGRARPARSGERGTSVP
jgi:hypothetical protein